ncbi:MAG: hypothetical protein Q8Q01_00605 [archaeon]|nr:hypothetical protein [archaeon]
MLKAFIKRIALISGLTLSGCGYVEENPDYHENKKTYWDEKFTCHQEIQEYIDSSIKVISNHRIEIQKTIEDTVDPQIQQVPASEVLDLIVSNQVPIICGRREKTGGVASWGYDGQFIVLNEPYFYPFAIDFLRNKYLLDENSEFDLKKAEEIMTKFGLEDGYHMIGQATTRAGDRLRRSIRILVHEFTHAAWHYNNLDPRHEKYNRQQDPFYAYDTAANEAYINLLYAWMDEVRSIKDKMSE